MNKTCDSCPTNCTQCTGDYTDIQCTKCLNGYVMDNYRCYLDCVTPGLVKSNGNCVNCASLCASCSNTMSNCTSCDTSSANAYLFNYKCLSECPSTYYKDASLYTCSKCQSPC